MESARASTGSSRIPFPVIIVGTRAQLVKMAPVLRELEARKSEFRLVFTGQHHETMQALLDDFGIEAEPVWLRQGQEADKMSKIIPWFFGTVWRLAVSRRTLLRDDEGARGIVVVHGDTLSTLAGALAGRLNRCQVAHVESGLRSFSLREPFPEELTRVTVFRLTDTAYCPGQWAAGNMSRHRVEVVDTGANTLLDAVRYARGRATDPVSVGSKGPYCVASVHRFENLRSDARLGAILDMILDIAETRRVVFVLHPATRARLKRSGRLGALRASPGMELRERMGYVEFLGLLARAEFVVTDGGSNQEELSYLGIPTLVVRERSERQEGLGSNAELLPANRDMAWRESLATIKARQVTEAEDFWDCHPSRVVVDHLLGDAGGQKGN